MEESENLSNLNPEQVKAVAHGDGPFLIVAGAGTGKTTVITRRFAYLTLNNKVKTDEILAITFTEKAAEEMESRLQKILPYGYFDFWVSTFHSFCERILRDHAIDLGLPLNFKILDEARQNLLILDNFHRFNLDYYRPMGNSTKFVAGLTKHFSRAKDEMIEPQDYLNYAQNILLDKDNLQSSDSFIQERSRLSEVANAYHTYQQLLLENSFLDFGDLINYTIKLFKDRPNILEIYRRKFKYILVDEFQDTNMAQYELIKLLAAPKNNLTVVADDDQSIYKFRGASYNNVLQFAKDFPNAQEVVLIKNYRSYQNILDIAYRFIKLNNPYRLEAQLAGTDKSINKALLAERSGCGEINIIKASTVEDEAEKVAEEILKLKTEDGDLNWNDFAILTRANSHAEIFNQILRWKNIPGQFMARRGLFVKPLVLDIINYLKLLDNYHENSAFYRVLISPIFAKTISNEDIVLLTNWAKKKSVSLFEALKQALLINNISSSALKEFKNLLSLIERHSQIARSQSAGKVIFAFLEDSGYLKLLIKQAENNVVEDIENINWLQQFFKKIESFELANTDKSVKNFIRFIDLMAEIGDEGSILEQDNGPDSVKIMTAHAAKGLEFKNVFIVNLAHLRFPTIERHSQIEIPDALIKEIIPEGDVHIQEERRLFYVAMTRAKDRLYFTFAEDYGGARKKKPSQFLYELNLVDNLEEIKTTPRDLLENLKIFNRRPKDELSYKFTLPKHFSYTQLTGFNNCPLQYKLSFILGIPRPGQGSLSFGQTIHQTLYYFINEYLKNKDIKQNSLFVQNQDSSKTLPPLEKLIEFYENLWVDDWYENKEIKERYRRKGEEILKKFYEDFKNNLPEVMGLEVGFQFKIGEDLIKGKIDRVDPAGDQEIELIDYKTGAPKDDKLSSEDKTQLLIYQLAAGQLFKEKVKRLTFYYLGNDQKISFLGNEKELEDVRQKVADWISKIKAGEFPPQPGWNCQFCDYKTICEYRQL